MSRRRVDPDIVLLVLACLVALMMFANLAIGALGLHVASQSSHAAEQADNRTSTLVRDVETLLLNGKTASAKSAKKTAEEVKTLLALQAFDHTQTQQGEKTLTEAIALVESHLDATILHDVNAAADRVAASFGR